MSETIAAKTPEQLALEAHTESGVKPERNCPLCGRFMEKIEPSTEPHRPPPGFHCKPCGWHPAHKNSADIQLGAALVGMIKSAPMNPTFRAQVQAIMLHPVPDTARDWESIKNWIEFEVPVPPVGSFTKPMPMSPVVGNGISVRVDLSETRFGNCNYRCTASGSADLVLSEADIDNILAISDNMRHLENGVADAMLEKGREADCEMDEGDHEYSNYEGTESEDFEWSYSDRAVFYARLRNWIIQNRPDEAARLGIQGGGQ